jgi:acetyl-CoA carboxylase/biotin carboxylase 1
VRKAIPFDGSFPPLGTPTAVSAKVHQRCADHINAARNVLAGYEHDIDEVRATNRKGDAFMCATCFSPASQAMFALSYIDYGRSQCFNSSIAQPIEVWGMKQVVKSLLSCLDDPQLPLLQWQECMAVHATRLPKEMKSQVLSHMSILITLLLDCSW